MTIRLIDIEAQKRFEQEVETYEERVKVRMDNPGISNEPWPNFPKQPEPMVDSRDEGMRPGSGSNLASPISSGDYRGGTADPRSRDMLDFDGNSQSKVKGYESVWNACPEEAPHHPFKIKE